MVRDPEMDGIIERTRGNAAELAGVCGCALSRRMRDFEVIAEEAVLPDEATHAVSTSEMPLALTRAEGRQTVARWLSEARVARDRLRLPLPPSRLMSGAGDVISVPEEGGRGLYRIDRVEQMGKRSRRPKRCGSSRSAMIPSRLRRKRGLAGLCAPVPVTPLFLDLPLDDGRRGAPCAAYRGHGRSHGRGLRRFMPQTRMPIIG